VAGTGEFSLSEAEVMGGGRLVVAAAPGPETTTLSVRIEQAVDVKGVLFTLRFPARDFHAGAVEFGSFLGGLDEVVALAITSQPGEVPVALVRVRPDTAVGVSGSGEIVRIALQPGPVTPPRSISRAPDGNANKPWDLTLLETGIPDHYQLRWHEVNTGDGNNDGNVNIQDVTPIAMRFGAWTDDGGNDEWDDLIDANRDRVINIADVTGIAMNFGTQLAGYNIYFADISDPLPNLEEPGASLSVLRPASPGKSRVLYTYDLELLWQAEVTVRPADPQGNEGVPSGPAVVSSGGAPAAPQNLEASAGEEVGVGVIKLTWDANAEGDLLYYRIFRRAGTGGYLSAGTVAGGEAAPSFGDDNRGNLLAPSVLYTYYVVAVNTVGAVSAPSAEVAASPFYPAPPAVPPWIEATGEGVEMENALKVTWGAAESPYLDGYEVWRQGPGEAAFSLLQSVGAGVTLLYDAGGLIAGETYSYRVRAFDRYSQFSDFTPAASAVFNPAGELAIVQVTTDRTTLQQGSSERAHLAVEVTDPQATVTWEAEAGSFPGGNSGCEVIYAPPASGGPRHVTISVNAQRGSETADSSVDLIITALESLGRFQDFSAPSFAAPASPYRALNYYVAERKVVLLDFGSIG